MGVGPLGRIAAAILLVSAGLPLLAAAQQVPRKVEIGKVTCGDIAALPRESHDRFLIYMNGYLDGTQTATTWDAEVVGKRIDEVERVCKGNPKSTVLDAFKRAWTR